MKPQSSGAEGRPPPLPILPPRLRAHIRCGLVFDIDETVVTTEASRDGHDVALNLHAMSYAKAQSLESGFRRYQSSKNKLLYPVAFKALFEFLIDNEIPFGVITAGGMGKTGFYAYLKAIKVSEARIDQVKSPGFFLKNHQANKSKAITHFTNQHKLQLARVALVDNSPKHCQEARGAGAHAVMANTTFATAVTERAPLVEQDHAMPIWFGEICCFLEDAYYDTRNLRTQLTAAFPGEAGPYPRMSRFFNVAPTPDAMLANLAYQLHCTSDKLRVAVETESVAVEAESVAAPARIYKSKVAKEYERGMFNHLLMSEIGRAPSFSTKLEALLVNCLKALAIGFADLCECAPLSANLLAKYSASSDAAVPGIPEIQQALYELNSQIGSTPNRKGPRFERRRVLRTCLIFCKMFKHPQIVGDQSFVEALKASQRDLRAAEGARVRQFASVRVPGDFFGAVPRGRFAVDSLLLFPPGGEAIDSKQYWRDLHPVHPPKDVWPVFAIYKRLSHEDAPEPFSFVEDILKPMLYGANDPYHFDKHFGVLSCKTHYESGPSRKNDPKAHCLKLRVRGIGSSVDFSVPALECREEGRKPVRRSNHGTMHAMRKFFYMDRLVAAIEKHGAQGCQKQAAAVQNDSILFNLVRLASASDRLGRTIDGEKGKRHSSRSADIFEQYALRYVDSSGLAPDVRKRYIAEIDYLKLAMIGGLINARSSGNYDRVTFYNALLMYAHKLDLSRCKPLSKKMLNEEFERLKIFPKEGGSDRGIYTLVAHTTRFMRMAKGLIGETNSIPRQRDCIWLSGPSHVFNEFAQLAVPFELRSKVVFDSSTAAAPTPVSAVPGGLFSPPAAQSKEAEVGAPLATDAAAALLPQ